MKSASALVVPAATLLLLLSAASLVLDASDTRDEVTSARMALEAARRAEQMASASLRAITPVDSPVDSKPEGVLEAPARARSINDALSDFIVALNRQAKARSVVLERIGTAANQQQAAFSGPEVFAREVPMTAGHIRAVRLSLRGRYSDYPQFKRFLDDVVYLSAIQSLKLSGDHFEASTEIYGVAP